MAGTLDSRIPNFIFSGYLSSQAEKPVAHHAAIQAAAVGGQGVARTPSRPGTSNISQGSDLLTAAQQRHQRHSVELRHPSRSRKLRSFLDDVHE
jgi:hypothetical protein